MARDNQKFKLTRDPPSRKIKKQFILFCEGKNTEPQYFQALKKNYPNALIVIEKKGAVPLTLANEANDYIKKRKKQKSSSFEDEDQIWVIFDKDKHPKIKEATKICENNNLRLGYSNPCFELWLMLHRKDFNTVCTHTQMQKKLEKEDSDYNSKKGKKVNYETYIKNIITAEKRANRQLLARKQEGEPHGCPSTTVCNLTIEIRKS